MPIRRFHNRSTSMPTSRHSNVPAPERCRLSHSATTAGTRSIMNAYCIPVSQNYCCNFGIKDVSMGSISNLNSSMPTSTAQSQVYNDYSSTMSTNIRRLSTNTITIQTGGAGNPMNTEIFVDWNLPQSRYCARQYRTKSQPNPVAHQEN